MIPNKKVKAIWWIEVMKDTIVQWMLKRKNWFYSQDWKGCSIMIVYESLKQLSQQCCGSIFNSLIMTCGISIYWRNWTGSLIRDSVMVVRGYNKLNEFCFHWRIRPLAYCCVLCLNSQTLDSGLFDIRFRMVTLNSKYLTTSFLELICD